MSKQRQQNFLSSLLRELNQAEEKQLSPLACLSSHGIRRTPDMKKGFRQSFAQDADRILHTRAYTRYIDKTQVFSLIDNDHITHRVLHVQMVSRIARTVGRFLGLNEDLIEAIALGHDIGHPPFGHEGERILHKLCRKYGLPGFWHNIQSVQFLENVEQKGRGWNLTLQVLDGILCHDGEARANRLVPARTRDFASFDQLLIAKENDPMFKEYPMTLEGCVVRLCDTIAYIGRDIEDAIELDLIERCAIPRRCGMLLGTTNGTIVYTLVEDLISNSSGVRASVSGSDWIGFSSEVAEALQELKVFNYEHIYHNKVFKPDFARIHTCYETLFEFYMNQLALEKEQRTVGRSFMHTMPSAYIITQPPAAIVRDYIAGMTDTFFLCQAENLGCDIPERSCAVN
jgi:dGTPase